MNNGHILTSIIEFLPMLQKCYLVKFYPLIFNLIDYLMNRSSGRSITLFLTRFVCMTSAMLLRECSTKEQSNLVVIIYGDRLQV